MAYPICSPCLMYSCNDCLGLCGCTDSDTCNEHSHEKVNVINMNKHMNMIEMANLHYYTE